MAGAVVRGSFWMMSSALASRLASFTAQILLGAILAKHDFGIYALAISVSSMATVLRDGGVKQILVQRQREYERLIGPVFWMAAAFNTATGVLIAGAAPVLAWAYGEPGVATLMLLIALAQPLGTPGAIYATRLQIDMRFREQGVITTVSALVRYLGSVVLAVAGFGAMSFVLHLPLLAAVEWALGWWYVRQRPWRNPPHPRSWWALFRETRWVLLGTLGVAGMNLGANIVIGFFVPTPVVGVYFFAFQIVVQIGVLVGANVIQVLVPALTRFADDLPRKRAASERALRQVMLLSSPLCLGLVATFGPLELLIWRAKWADAAEAVQFIGLFYPAHLAASVALSVMQARGRFRAWGLSTLTMAAATLGSAALGAWIHRHNPSAAAWIAAYTGAWSAAAAIGITLAAVRGIGVRAGDAIAAIGPPWLLAVGAAAIAMNFDLYVLGGATPGASGLPLRAESLARTGATGVVFSIAFAFLARLLLPAYLREALAVAPARLRPLAAALLRLK